MELIKSLTIVINSSPLQMKVELANLLIVLEVVFLVLVVVAIFLSLNPAVHSKRALQQASHSPPFCRITNCLQSKHWRGIRQSKDTRLLCR